MDRTADGSRSHTVSTPGGEGCDAVALPLGRVALPATAVLVPTRFLLGDWRVDVTTRRLDRGDDSVTLEPRPMAVLVALCRQPGVVISAESLLQECWPEAPAQGDNPVHKVVAGLRRALQDSATRPVYLETIRKRGYRLIAPVRVLAGHGPRSHVDGWRGQSPFRGLEPFDEAHASVFFGRDAAVDEMRSRLARQWRQGRPLVVLLGPSGSGKTSLVQAGLLPALAEPLPETGGLVDEAGPLRICTAATADLGALGRTADGTVLDTWAGLAGALLDWDLAGAPLLSGYSIDSLAAALRERADDVVRQLQIALDAAGGPQGRRTGPPLLVLDRLEALLQQPAPHVDAWLATLDRLLASGRILVLAICRNDFYAALARHPILMEDKEAGSHIDLPPPGAVEISQIVRLPARAAGLSFGGDDSGLNRLDDRLCADAMQSPDALPLLQYTLQQLYLNREPGDVLSWAAYEALGGLEGAIGRRAEALLDGLPAARQGALPSLLSRLVTLAGDEAAPTSRWMPDDELVDADERALVETFVDARLLVADLAASGKGYRVAHEALLRRWPRVTAWVAGHRAALVARDGLAPWVARWVEAGRAGTLLLPRGAMLWTVTRALAEAPALFGPQERDFIRRSQRRLRRQRWGLGASTVGALLLAGVAVVAAVGYAHQADLAAERDRQSRQLTSFMLGELADGLRPIGKLNLLGSIGEQGLKVLASPDRKGAADAAADTLQRARALVVIGEVNSSRGQGRTDIAVDALEAARRMLEALAPGGQPPDLDAGDYFRTLGAASFWLGQIAYDAGQLDAATQAMDRYRDASARWRQLAPTDPAAMAELGYALNSLGSITFRRGLWQAAKRWFEESLTLKREALSRAATDAEAREGVANSLTWLGLVAHVCGRPIEALRHYDAARQERVALAAGRADEQLRLRDLGTLELRRAEAIRAAGRPSEAVAVMAAGVERLRAAERHDPSNAYWRIDRLHAESHLVVARLDAGQAVDRELNELSANLSTPADPDAARELLRREALLRVATATAQRSAARGDWVAARRLLDDSAESMEELLRQRPHYWQLREVQARRALLTLGRDADNAAADCARLREGLQSTVDGGQAGLVLQAWLAARACASGTGAEPEAARRLVADGYVPLSLPSVAARLPVSLSTHP